jgi:hypothetical protein
MFPLMLTLNLVFSFLPVVTLGRYVYFSHFNASLSYESPLLDDFEHPITNWIVNFSPPFSTALALTVTLLYPSGNSMYPGQ